jgi:hypothetical protein
VANAINAKPNAVQRVATLLEGSPAFERRRMTCALCGKLRLVILARPR